MTDDRMQPNASDRPEQTKPEQVGQQAQQSQANAAAHQGRCHRACQQDRADGLGHDGQGRAIQGTRRACGINEIAPDIRRDVKVGRANST